MKITIDNSKFIVAPADEPGHVFALTAYNNVGKFENSVEKMTTKEAAHIIWWKHNNKRVQVVFNNPERFGYRISRHHDVVEHVLVPAKADFVNGKATVKVTPTCPRCGGSGVWAKRGTCFNCGGTGKANSPLTFQYFTHKADAQAFITKRLENREKRRLATLAKKNAQDAERIAHVGKEDYDYVQGLIDADEGKNYQRVSDFLRSVHAKITGKWEMSSKQVNAYRSAVAKLRENLAKREAEAAATPGWTEGRHEVTGTIISTKWVDSNYGTTLKGLVKLEDGRKCWGTVGNGFPDKGAVVSFTATFKPSPDDATFAFYSRPSKAKEVA